MTNSVDKAINDPSPARQALIATVILAIGAAAALAIRFSGEKAATTLDKAPTGRPPVVVASAREIPLRSPATYAGRLEARRTVDLAAEIAGRLVHVGADVGDRLPAAAAAFRLDDRDARLAIEDRRARLASAEARARQASRQAQRRDRLGEEGISSPENVEQARLEGDVSRADVVVAEQELRRAERELEKTTTTAPWSGRVVARHVDPGAWVTPGQAVLRLVDLSKIDVHIDIPAADAVHLRVGDEVPVRLPALPGESLLGRVRFVASEASDADHQFPVAIELAGDQRLSAGMIAEVEFDLDHAGRAVAVPLDAIDRDDLGTFVWRVEAGRARRQAVVMAGARAGQAVLTEGLATGDQVIVTLSAGLEDGLEIKANAP